MNNLLIFYISLISTMQRTVSSQDNDSLIAREMLSTIENVVFKKACCTNRTNEFRFWWQELLDTYDNRIRPYFNVKPLRITLGLSILSISSISESDMQWTVEMYFHQYWRDPRLYFNSSDFNGKKIMTLPHNADMQIWTPDTSFINAIKSNVPKVGSVSHLSFLRVTEGGYLFWDRRLSVTATCVMDLTMYPFDKQACSLDLSSFGHTVESVVYKWKSTPVPVNLSILRLPDFDGVDHYSRVTNQSFVAGVYSVPQLCIVFERRAGFCTLQLFIPATSCVGASWISLWLESETEFADIIAILFAVIFLSYSYNAVMPKVTYIKAMDVYLGACFIFAFLSLVKLAVVKYMSKRLAKRNKYSVIHVVNDERRPRAKTCAVGVNAIHRQDTRVSIINNGNCDNDHDTYWKALKVFHVGSQLVLPLAFAVFCVFYFFIYPYLHRTGGKCF